MEPPVVITDTHKAGDRNTREILWNLPKHVKMLDTLPLNNLPIEAEEVKHGRHKKRTKPSIKESVRSSEAESSEDDLLLDVSYRELLELCNHIRGTNDPPKTLREAGLLAINITKCTIEQSHFVELIETDKFVNFNRVVLWGPNRCRSLAELFSRVTPVNYAVSEAKTYLLSFAKGERFKRDNNKGIYESYRHMCQACHMKIQNLRMFVNHLNRKTSELTYMCRYCGYLRFTNVCALSYHRFTDNRAQPCLEYCIACRQYVKSLSQHLSNSGSGFKEKCNNCHFIAHSVCSYNFHIAYHIKELPYICPECGDYFSFRDSLENHMEKVCFFNYKSNFLVCPSCFIIFSDFKYFEAHVISKHYQKLIKCLVCQELFSSQSLFMGHRTTNHRDSECSYKVLRHCDLCPESTFLTNRERKHAEGHASQSKCCIIVYKCECNFYTCHKKKFIEHKKRDKCHQTTFTRPQIMKICSNCYDIQSFNYLQPEFVCESCQIVAQPSLGILKYYCEICHVIIDYKWDSVLDHFFSLHKNVDLLLSSEHTMIITLSDKIPPGRHLKQGCIIEIDANIMNKVLKQSIVELSSATNDPDSDGIPL